MAGSNPEVTSIIAILIGAAGTTPPVPSQEFGAAMQAHNLSSDNPFGQELAPRLPAVQHDTVGLLGVAHHISDYGLL